MNASSTSLFIRNGRAILFGPAVEQFLWDDKVARVSPSRTVPDCFESASLCGWQAEMHARGFVAVELVATILGWSVRYQSGLDNFAILAGPRSGSLSGTFLDAARFAQAWQRALPDKRYVVCLADRLSEEDIRVWKDLAR